ncbi:MAG: hypothetical protein IJB81_10345 [Clostridia bacterium]|nr:hypothetical protein [Clostridia bacterium]
MNNGQPPYGDPSAWGQQGNQANPAQYPVQPNPYQPDAAGGQPMYGQQGFTQPQQPVQSFSQPFQPVQTYQQQPHPQQQAYQQQTWQPYAPQQPAGPQPQQFYGQGTPQQPGAQQAYPQFNQMGQQVQQGYGTGYSGYYSQPQEKKFEVPLDVIGKVILFGVLPVLFILAMALGVPALKWVFLAGAVAGIVLMWMKDIVSPNMRLTLSMVLGVMAVIALVGALGGAPRDAQNNNVQGGNNAAQQQAGAVQMQQFTPISQPTATPAPEDAADSAVEQLMSFFYFWSVGNDEAMLSLTAPSWRASVDKPANALFVLLLNRTPQDDYEVTHITGTDSDALRTATVKVTIDKNNGVSKMDRYAFKVLMKKEDGIWYVDPQSLASNEKETATETAVSANTTPTQPPLYTGTPETILYYNANGGSMYHLDPDCQSVGKKYKPMASFRFVDLDQSPYNELRPCNVCGAPIPDD